MAEAGEGASEARGKVSATIAFVLPVGVHRPHGLPFFVPALLHLSLKRGPSRFACGAVRPVRML